MNFTDSCYGRIVDSELNREQNLIENAVKQKHTEKIDGFKDSSSDLHFRKMSIPSDLPDISKKHNKKKNHLE